MPVEAKPLFRPDVLRPHLTAFRLPEYAEAMRPKLADWAELITSGRADSFKEQEILPDFLTDFFCGLLGYTRPADGGERFTISREKHIEVDGKFADAVLGSFRADQEEFFVALEGKGPKDPLDRPFGGRRMSAVDQGYRYAINLPCDWIIVTSIRQTRLYYKGTNQYTYERFDTEKLATDEALLKKLVFLLGAERVVPIAGRCHLHSLRDASESVDRELTKKYYVRYADMRQDAFARLCYANPDVSRPEILTCTQKLLDRVLFCAFCEDRGLLPDNTIAQAYEHRDPYRPRPIWENFRGLFRAINEGNADLHIPAYNGGLFADDPLLDGLQVPDEVCGYFKDLADYDYRPAHEVVADMVEITQKQQTTCRDMLDWLRVEHNIEKPGKKLESSLDLDSDTFATEVKKRRGRKNPLTAAALRSLRDEYIRSIEPARTLAAEASQLEHEISNLVNEAYGLTPEEIDLMWKTAPPRMPIAHLAK